MYDIVGDIQKTAGRQYPQRFLDKDDNERDHIRTRWWGECASTYRSVAMMDDKSRQTLSDRPVPAEVLLGYTDNKLVFVGHYWLCGTPEPMSDCVACVDYTAPRPAPASAA